MDCVTEAEFVEPRIDLALTQYRESPNLLGYARAIIGQVHDVHSTLCDLPERFDIAMCTGDQLTIVAKRLGLQRCHCVCDLPPRFGYPCDPPGLNQTFVGYCEGYGYGGCGEAGTSDICITDDEMFRGYVFARAFQLLRLFEIDSVTAAAQQIWGESANVVDMQQGRVCVAPGRALTPIEKSLLPVAFRVLPIAPGMRTFVDLSTGPIFNYGAGWGGYCDGSTYFCPTAFDAFSCA